MKIPFRSLILKWRLKWNVNHMHTCVVRVQYVTVNRHSSVLFSLFSISKWFVINRSTFWNLNLFTTENMTAFLNYIAYWRIEWLRMTFLWSLFSVLKMICPQEKVIKQVHYWFSRCFARIWELNKFTKICKQIYYQFKYH